MEVIYRVLTVIGYIIVGLFALIAIGLLIDHGAPGRRLKKRLKAKEKLRRQSETQRQKLNQERMMGDQANEPAVDGEARDAVQESFQLAKFFHTDDCYRARGLTTEEIVRRTFIGVDSDTLQALEGVGSSFDVSDCETWRRSYGKRFEEPLSCRELGETAERLGFRVIKAGQQEEHAWFRGVRLAAFDEYPSETSCVGCGCHCEHQQNLVDTVDDSSGCACKGCYCVVGCATGHLQVDDSDDPLMNLTMTDINLHLRTKRYALTSRSHDDENTTARSFTADELVQLTLAPLTWPFRGELNESLLGLSKTVRVDYEEWHKRFGRHLDDSPDERELADAAMRQGRPVDWNSVYGFEFSVVRGLEFEKAFWLPNPYSRRAGQSPRSKATPPLKIQDGSHNRQRYELRSAWWHSRRCTTRRWLTSDQIAQQLLSKSPAADTSDESVKVPWEGCTSLWPGSSDCGIHGIDSSLVRSGKGPSCVELAEAARRLGIRVEAARKSWPLSRSHFFIVGAQAIAAFGSYLDPSCVGCKCDCPLCDDCSQCGCDCEGCMCAALCATGDCIT